MTPTKAFAAATITFVALVALTGCNSLVSATAAGTDDASSPAAQSAITASFVRVIDGDTIAVKPTDGLSETGYGEHSVRLLGIDAPEMHKTTDQAPDCGAQAATDHLEKLLAGQRTVTLVFDTVSDHTDRFGRSLAYVEVDGHDLNLEQTAGGFAEAWYPRSEPAPTRYDSYRSAEDAAQQVRAGSWGACGTLGR